MTREKELLWALVQRQSQLIQDLQVLNSDLTDALAAREEEYSELRDWGSSMTAQFAAEKIKNYELRDQIDTLTSNSAVSFGARGRILH